MNTDVIEVENKKNTLGLPKNKGLISVLKHQENNGNIIYEATSEYKGSSKVQFSN